MHGVPVVVSRHQISQKVENVYKNAAVVVDAAEMSLIAGRRPGAHAMQWPNLPMYSQVRGVHTPHPPPLYTT